MVEIEARLDELSSLGLRRRTRLVSGPQGAHVLLDGQPVLLLCSNNYLGLADHPRIREAAADAAMRWGVGAGASRLVSGTMTIHRRLEQRLADFKQPRAGAAVRLRLPRQHRHRRRARTTGRCDLLRRPQPRLDRRRLSALPRRGVRLRPLRRRAPAMGNRKRGGSRHADRHRQRLLDGRRHRAARGDRRAGGLGSACGRWSTRPMRPARSAPAAAARWRLPGSRTRST